jgi:putative membrane protein
VRAGRAGGAVLALIVLANFPQHSTIQNGIPQQSSPNHVIDIVILALGVFASIIGWAVTTWHLDGDTVQVHTGLLRRKTVRVPLSRVQAVDVLEPLFARIIGLAEVRVRTAGGSGGDARLMYLKAPDAYRVRAALLAVVHGLPDATPAPPELPSFRVRNGRLVASVALSSASIGLLLGVSTLISGLIVGGPLGKALIALNGGTWLYVIALGRNALRRVFEEWDFELAEAADGLRIRCGLFSKVAETIPYGRIQAVRMTEPLFWRLFGWRRLELHLAGHAHHKSNEPQQKVQRALLPVGSAADAEHLLARILPQYRVPLTPPPRRAWLRAPLSYHFLAIGRNEWCAVSVSGRIRRITEYAPLAKVQSIRSVQGPLQRWLRLSSIHLDVAGRHTHVQWVHRSADEVAQLMAVLPAECEAARATDRRLFSAVGLASDLPRPRPPVEPIDPPLADLYFGPVPTT